MWGIYLHSADTPCFARLPVLRYETKENSLFPALPTLQVYVER